MKDSFFRYFLAAFLYVGAVQAEVDFFGLDHFALGDAVLFTNQAGFLQAEQVSLSGADGVGTEVGAVDSGVFLFPNTATLSDGYSMRANVYGSVDGVTNSLIGSVSGYRSDYSTFQATADYSALGADSLTFQLWSGNTKLKETTVTDGFATIYANYSVPPRVNPWALLEDGQHGTVIEFPYPPLVTLPGCNGTNCTFVLAERIVIRPNHATRSVEFVSRSEVFGGGGLPMFTYDGMAIGMFGRAHTALGSARFQATNGVLTMERLISTDGAVDGVLSEFTRAALASIQLVPLEIAIPNTNAVQERIELNGSGHYYSYTTLFASAWLENSNGSLFVSGNIPSVEQQYKLVVFSNAVAVASEIFSNNVPVPISGEPRVIGGSARADALAGPAGLSFSFDRLATISLSAGNVAGDRVLVSSPTETAVSDITGLAITTRAIPSFSIVRESATSSIPELTISRSGESITLSWLDPAHVYIPVSRANIEDSWSYLPVDPTYAGAMGSVTLPVSMDTEFFSLLYLVND